MFRFQTRIVALSLLSLSLAVTGCGGVEAEDVAPEQQVSSDANHEAHADHAHDQDIGTTESAACGNCDNCVLHARCLQPKLPYGLTYWSDKVAIINSNHAHKGCVAMIPTSSSYGHVAYVSNVDTAPSPNRITLREANWVGNTCSSRTGTKDGLNIRNYWCPAGVHGSNCAGPM
ncbi:hypothetical protein [Archangium violaceum]|uniref:Peptidase C51 domain-containing protein n=1 Tax=Archangium violaceum Cb vi76 TaxID=1406225 RepID=A0A084SLU9_9BACT|nr:hypothetical protein [Archangium violaceum]KFA89434.1 hypothetical protein Q664_34160 [Archangium violaceum Cb vi76]